MNRMHELLAQAERLAAADLSIAIESPLWIRAVEWLRTYLSEELKVQIRAAMSSDPDHWIAPYHFMWGMAIRNQLRGAGFGESEFGIENLDNIYVQLVEQAVLPCERPPAGWWCSGLAGHDGPCAARPVPAREVPYQPTWIDRLRRFFRK